MADPKPFGERPNLSLAEPPYHLRAIRLPSWWYSSIGYQDDSQDDETLRQLHVPPRSPPEDGFLFNIRCLIYMDRQWILLDPLAEPRPRLHLEKWYWIPRTFLLNGDMESVFPTVSDFFTGSSVALDTDLCETLAARFVHDIITFGHILANLPRNQGRDLVTVRFWATTSNGDRDILRAVALEEDDQQTAQMGSFLINSWTRAKYEASGEGSSVSSCVVCLEEILKGEDVIWLPCTHFYHGDCILQWLKRKGSCPACRLRA